MALESPRTEVQAAAQYNRGYVLFRLGDCLRARDAFATAGLKAGDSVKVEANGPGRVTLTRLDELLDKYRGALTPGAITNEDIGRLRDEWP